MMEITYLESFVEGLNEVMHAKQQLLEAQGKYKIDVRSTVLQIIRKMASLPKYSSLEGIHKTAVACNKYWAHLIPPLHISGYDLLGW